nr:hypothetical protein Itr_chr05CG15670 [Ipomoea trifida]
MRISTVYGSRISQMRISHVSYSYNTRSAYAKCGSLGLKFVLYGKRISQSQFIIRIPDLIRNFDFHPYLTSWNFGKSGSIRYLKFAATTNHGPPASLDDGGGDRTWATTSFGSGPSTPSDVDVAAGGES